MVEQADLILDGEVCELCGDTFTQPHGCPVCCKECWSNLTLAERKLPGRMKATYPVLDI
jgi:hypothetical protein